MLERFRQRHVIDVRSRIQRRRRPVPRAAGEAITLNYWAWGTAQDGLVEAWNKSHPNVQVTHTDAGGGTDSSAKLLTAARAGEAPDVSVVEYQTLPAMIVGDVAADITEYVGDAKGAFTDSTWDLTTFNGAVYGVPQDVGPMALVYNQARFAALGITVPTTWAEFATAAEQVRKADPTTYIATFSPDEFGFFAGMSQQAGAKWWQVDGENWTVGIDDEASMKVADYWQDLVDRDLVKVESVLTPEYNKELNAGQMLSWPSALWAPGRHLRRRTRSRPASGRWHRCRSGPPGDAKVGYQGGSAVVVTTSSKHPKEAAEFAAWINSSQEGADIQLSTGQYPASTLGQEAAVKQPAAGADAAADRLLAARLGYRLGHRFRDCLGTERQRRLQRFPGRDEQGRREQDPVPGCA